MSLTGNKKSEFDNGQNFTYAKKSNTKIFPLKEQPAFDLKDFKDWDIRVGDYESDTDTYSPKGDTFFAVMKIIAIIVGVIGLGAVFFFALSLVGTL